MKKILTIIATSLIATSAQADDFSISFNWDGLELCDSGQPNIVDSPVFTLENVPEGTEWLYFDLTDLDYPSYPHGKGWIEYDGDRTLAGVFKYFSPCPPDGVHNYEWKVTAAGSKDIEDELGTAASVLRYPE